MSEEAHKPIEQEGNSPMVFTDDPTWAAIGLHLPTEQRADEVLAEISDRVSLLRQLEKEGSKLAVYRYDDRSGAAVVFDVVDEKISDVHQAFLSSTLLEAKWVEMGAGFALIALTDENGKVLARACAAMQDGLLHEPGREGFGQLRISALAQKPEVYGGTVSYEASKTAEIFRQAQKDGVKLNAAQESSQKETEIKTQNPPQKILPAFISTGAVAATSGQPAHAGIVMAGTILEAELHSNTMTGQNFWVARVNVGFTLDVCVHQNAIEQRLTKGNVLAGSFALLAQVEQ